MPQHIGIIALTPEGSAGCYRKVARRAGEIEDPLHRPSVTLHNQPFSTYIDMVDGSHWEGIAEMVLDSAYCLHNAGADFCIMPDNIAHHVLPMIEDASPLEIINMVELVAQATLDSGCKNVGLLGTSYIRNSSTYQTALGLRGIKLLVANEEDTAALDEIIFREVMFGKVRPEAIERTKGIIDRLNGRGCDALIVGSTESSVLVDPSAMSQNIFDPVELLAEAAVHRAASVDDAITLDVDVDLPAA